MSGASAPDFALPAATGESVALSSYCRQPVWAARAGEPGHTFILVDAEQHIAWIHNYGSLALPAPTMYVPIDELIGDADRGGAGQLNGVQVKPYGRHFIRPVILSAF